MRLQAPHICSFMVESLTAMGPGGQQLLVLPLDIRAWVQLEISQAVRLHMGMLSCTVPHTAELTGLGLWLGSL